MWQQTFNRLAAVLLLLVASQVQAANYRPFVLAESGGGDLAASVAEVQGKLESAGFTLVGHYQPYAGSEVLVVTNDTLQQLAKRTDFGLFGAVIRVALTEHEGKVQVSYNEPAYLFHAYRMSGDIEPVTSALRQALGRVRDYGSAEGMNAARLRGYHYKFLMPYFDDRIELVRYGNHQQAIDKVEAALAAGKGGAAKVYRIDIPGGDNALYGVALSDGCSGDSYIMERIDAAELKATAHLPYEIVVRGGTVYTLPAEFRIAINFPDLSMMGSNSFASIMCAPGEIKRALTEAAGGSVSSNSNGW